LTLEGASLVDVLPLFSEIAEVPVACSTCDGVRVSGSVDEVPWDCLLEDLAAQAALRVHVREESITLEPLRSGS